MITIIIIIENWIDNREQKLIEKCKSFIYILTKNERTNNVEPHHFFF
jgi:hypothetical protein